MRLTCRLLGHRWAEVPWSEDPGHWFYCSRGQRSGRHYRWSRCGWMTTTPPPNLSTTEGDQHA